MIRNSLLVGFQNLFIIHYALLARTCSAKPFQLGGGVSDGGQRVGIGGPAAQLDVVEPVL